MDDDDHDHHGNTLFSLALALSARAASPMRSCGEVHLIGPACSLAQPSKAHWPTGSGRNRTGEDEDLSLSLSYAWRRLPPPHSLLLRRRILTNPQQPSLPPRQSFCNNRCKLKMAGFGSLAPKTKNFVVAGGLSAFVLGVYYYTMRAVGGTDELQVAIDKFEDMKKKDAGNSSTAGS
uniref:Uncharacterized protein n=3 Tax=Oryza TaxID=4527 RepID=A0A0D9ZT38_9ORYZ